MSKPSAAGSGRRDDLAGLVERWNQFLGNGGFFNPGMTASCNEGAMRQLALDTRDYLAALRQGSPALATPKRWTEVLCQQCGGNGVIKIPGGISQCPRCDGRCYDPAEHRVSFCADELEAVLRPGSPAQKGTVVQDTETGIRYYVLGARIGGFDLAVQRQAEELRPDRWVSDELFARIFSPVADAPATPATQQELADAAEMLWVVLANVSGGDWTQQSADWQEAAARWRDNYFAALKAASSPALADPPQEPDSILDVRLWIHEWCQQHGYIHGQAAIGYDGVLELLKCDRLARIDSGRTIALSDVPALADAPQQQEKPDAGTMEQMDGSHRDSARHRDVRSDAPIREVADAPAPQQERLARIALDMRREAALWPKTERAQQTARLLLSFARDIESQIDPADTPALSEQPKETP